MQSISIGTKGLERDAVYAHSLGELRRHRPLNIGWLVIMGWVISMSNEEEISRS